MDILKTIIVECKDEEKEGIIKKGLEENGFNLVIFNLFKNKNSNEIKSIAQILKNHNHYIIDFTNNDSLKNINLNVVGLSKDIKNEDLVEEVLKCLI